MVKMLCAYQIVEKIVNVIEILFKDITASLISQDRKTTLFDVKVIVLQSDTLAP